MGCELRGSLEVGLFETERGAEVVLVGEVEASEVVEEGDALSGWVER